LTCIARRSGGSVARILSGERCSRLGLILAGVSTFFVRARREEEALAADFGEAWQAHDRRVPAGPSRDAVLAPVKGIP
jgi:hypothetical protein